MPSANVRSLDALRRLHPALIRIQSDLAVALSGLRTELNRGLNWIDHDCPAHWQRQIRMGFDRVARARTELNRKQMITVAGHKADCIEEQKLLRLAKQKLEQAQEKVRICRQWSVKTHRNGDEYKSRIGRVEQSLAHRLPMLIANLERMIKALEAYASSERRPISDTQGVVESPAPETENAEGVNAGAASPESPEAAAADAEKPNREQVVADATEEDHVSQSAGPARSST
jgi:hypothetical protein